MLDSLTPNTMVFVNPNFLFLYFQEKVDELNLKIGGEAKVFDMDKITDKDILRKLKWLRDLGTSALGPEKLKR